MVIECSTTDRSILTDRNINAKLETTFSLSTNKDEMLKITHKFIRISPPPIKRPNN